MIKLFGFGIIKNGIKFDFPFKESILSLNPICQKIYYILGDSVDATDDAVHLLNCCFTEKSTWDMSLKDGHVIGVETNKALALLKSKEDSKNSWGIYLQADEVLHEEDYQILLNDLERAENEGYDSLSFRYLHFWQSHHQIAISKTWYPHEIRAIKLDSPIVSWGDGQSFANCKKTFFTEARIFHYGHIREKEAYAGKMQFQAAFHFKGLRYYRKRIGAFINHHKQRTISFLGTHPQVMKERILRLGDKFNFEPNDELIIIGDELKYSQDIKLKINAKKIQWLANKKLIPKNFSGKIIYLEKSKLPIKMYSDLAQEWSPDFQLLLCLSENNVSMKCIENNSGI